MVSRRPLVLSGGDLRELPAGDTLLGTSDSGYSLADPSGDTTGTTDTTAIRAMISAVAAAGGGTVRAQPGKVYQVAPVTTQTVAHPSGSTASRNPCVTIPTGVILDMNGSTLQLRGSTPAWLVANANTSGTGTRDHDLGLRNAVLDFRSVAYTDRAGMHLSHVDRLELRNVKLINGSYYAAWIYNVTDSVFDGLDADGIVGQPWQFGDPQAGGDGLNQVYRSRFGSIRAKNVTLLNTGSQPGNVLALVATDCTIDTIFGYNCSAGVKIQAPGKRNAVGTVVLDTIGEASALNSGFKFQGDGTWGNLKDCSVGQVVALDQANMGLAMLYTENCSVGTYIGRGNCLLATNGDVFLGGGQNDYIGSINSTNSGGSGVRISQAPSLTQIPTGFRLPNIRVTNPGQVSIIKSGFRIDYAGATGTVGDLVCVDNQVTKTMNRGVDVTVTGVVGSVATFSSTGHTDVAFASSSTGFAAPASTVTPDATTSVKGKAVLLGGTAAAPTVPATAVTGLATVATSGAYTDLSAKPIIPAAYTDLTGTVPQSALPAIALTEHLGAVASQTAMLALTGQRGDWATRTDLGTDWQLIAEPSTSLGSWRQMTYPASPVSSVNGRTGPVTGLAEATDVATSLSGKQPVDSDLTAIAALDPADGAFLGRQSGAWTGRTPTQTRTDLGLATIATSGSASDITTGTLPDGVIPPGIARDTEVQTAIDGQQSALTTAIANVPEQARDALAAALVAGTGVTITPNDGADTITIAATGGSGGTSPTGQRDATLAPYSATGDGTTDDTAALQAAINATPAGGTCYLPPGVYRTSAPLVLPPQRTLQGAHSEGLTYSSSFANPCVIRPLVGFTGRAVVRLLDKTTGSYTSDSTGQRIRNVTIDGTAATAVGVAGVECYGFIREALFDHVTVRKVTGDGFAVTGYGALTGDARPPQSLRWENCYADNVGLAGFVTSGAPDCVLIGCNSQGSGTTGYFLGTCPNTQLIGCRAEWSGQHNFYITGGFGNGQGSGSVLLSGCSSDRANFNGLYIDSDGAAAHNIVGFSARRDGRNGNAGGGNYAAIAVATATTNPVTVSGVTVYPGTNDDGAGTNSPQYGVYAPGTTPVTVSSGYIHAAVAAATGGSGLVVQPGVGQATGTTASPTRVGPQSIQPLDSDLTALAGLTPANDDVVQRKAGAWTNRTPAQVKTDLALTKGDIGLGAVENRPTDYTVPSGVVRTSVPRTTRLDTSLAGLVSGRLTLVGVYLVAGDVVTSLTFFAGSTAAGTPTNQWFSLYSGALAQLGVTADNTTTAWAASGAKTLALTTPYTVQASGLYYAGVTVVAATVPTLTAATHASTAVVARPPILAGGSTTGLTNPASAPATAGAMAAIFGVPYVEIS